MSFGFWSVLGQFSPLVTVDLELGVVLLSESRLTKQLQADFKCVF